MSKIVLDYTDSEIIAIQNDLHFLKQVRGNGTDMAKRLELINANQSEYGSKLTGTLLNRKYKTSIANFYSKI